MRISHVEILNFRKLLSVRVDFADQTTLFVGANNSGKTSAMLALRTFLVEPAKFSANDFTLSHWSIINAIGTKWEAAKQAGRIENPSIEDWAKVLPSLDIWLHVEDGEIHHVNKLIPTLDWNGGLLGVRLRLEPKDLDALYKDYLAAISDASAMKAAVAKGDGQTEFDLKLWPENLTSFLERKIRTHFTVRTYPLDPSKCKPPENGQANPQALLTGIEPIEGDPLSGLIRINEINAQRGFGNPAEADGAGDGGERKDSRKLSDQLRRYYADHLDPFKMPEPQDLEALQAIEAAQRAFDKKLEASFEAAISEVEGLNYPGVTDPKLRISTRLRAVDGLDHDAAVQYEIDMAAKGPALRLPESYNGLGYQNLISMIFRLMSFRDAWMRVGKAGKGPLPGETVVEPLHLVLVEEPEAHLHAQVQQVFIRKAYDVLRARPELGDNPHLTTQLVVSTHSSHVAHETSFECLRYFRRLPAGMASDVPVSTVINLSEVFGGSDETRRFVTRYLKAQHCDLFFADAAILVEGPAERMLVPHFLRTNFDFLRQCYITLLEIGGSHAHRLRPLIEHLGLLTLIITDLDAGNHDSGAAEPPARGQKQKTNNTTLTEWLPKIEEIDALLDAKLETKEIVGDKLFAVRVAYQSPIVAQPVGGAAVEALANTFEDALVFENIDFFSKLKGHGLVSKFNAAIKEHKDVAGLGKAMFENLRNGKKAEFALDVIDAEGFDTLKVPTYIAEGLKWLDNRLRKKQVDSAPAAKAVGGGA